MNEKEPRGKKPIKRGLEQKPQEEAPTNMQVIESGITELKKVKEAAEAIRSLISIEKILENHEKGIPGMMLEENAPDVIKENIETIGSFFDSKNTIFSTFKNEFINLGGDAIKKKFENKSLFFETRDLLEAVQNDIVVFNEGKELFRPFLDSLKNPENENLGINHDHATQVMRNLIGRASSLGFEVEDLLEKLEKLKELARG